MRRIITPSASKLPMGGFEAWKFSGRSVVAVVLSVFAAAVMFLAFTGEFFGRRAPITIAGLYDRAAQFGEASDDFQAEGHGSKRACRTLDYKLPDSSRVFVLHMLGPEGRNNLGYYYLLTYYLFPRKVDIAIGEPARFITGPAPERIGHYTGTPAQSVEQLKTLGYEVVVDITATSDQFLWLTPQPTQPRKQQLHPYIGDAIKAFLLPVLVALFGAGVVNLLFPNLYPTLGYGERAASGLAVGTLIAGQTTFGLRLIGLRAEPAIWWLLLAWAAYVMVRWAFSWSKRPRADARAWLHPALLGLLPLLILFFVLFRLAGQLSLMEFDAIASWAFKSKIIHASAGHALIEHFSNPAWAHAHFDYPPLVPSLHALTFGVIGRVNEFVTKFWPVWMVLLVVMAVLSACQWPRHNALLGLALALGLAFMPFVLDYVLQEGATIPMFFFLTLAAIQIACGIIDKSRERLELGILTLAGAAMCKFEGCIVMGLWLALLVVYRQTRSLLRLDRRSLGLAVLVAVLFLPYLLLRLQIPLLTPESTWAKYLIESPGRVLAHFPKALFTLLATQSVDGEFARWSSPDRIGMIWSGQWKGVQSLLNELTLGFIWVGVLLTIVLLWRQNAWRKPVLLFGGVFLSFAGALGVVLGALPETLDNMAVLIAYCDKSTGGRFLSPLICAWVTGLALLVARSSFPLPEAPLPATGQESAACSQV